MSRRRETLPPGISGKGNVTMRVRARLNVKDAAGWHRAGDVFETEAELGDAVEVLDKAEQVTLEEITERPEEPEKPKEEPKPARSRRKKASA